MELSKADRLHSAAGFGVPAGLTHPWGWEWGGIGVGGLKAEERHDWLYVL